LFYFTNDSALRRVISVLQNITLSFSSALFSFFFQGYTQKRVSKIVVKGIRKVTEDIKKKSFPENKAASLRRTFLDFSNALIKSFFDVYTTFS